MKRSNYWMLSTLLGLAACNGDNGANATNSDSNSGTASDSATDTANTDSNSAGSDSATGATDSMGSASMSGGSSGSTDSVGSASATGGTTGGSASASATGGSATATATGGTATSGTTGGSTGNTTAGTTTGGEQDGLCEEPGLVVGCYTHNPATQGVGECKDGTQVCVAIDLDLGEWSDCEDDVGPSLEVCDGDDNDCDGLIDEDQGEINCGLGKCNHTEPACVNGMPGSCDPFEGATPEVCNGEDDDCDGDIDEGLGNDKVDCGVGKCEHSVTACMGGQPPVCDPFEGATPEVCNGIDDDCDGMIDEGFGDLMCGTGQCAKTVPECVNGMPQVCDPFEGAENEICDGIDNDCDGLIDEDLGNWQCGAGLCQNSTPKCVMGVPQPESTCMPGGTVEICGNGIDDDCDGDAPPCGESYQVGTDTSERPIDVIWAIDSSTSMAVEMANVETNINAFANQLNMGGGSNALHLIVDRDTQVDGGADFHLCVAPPLANANCADKPPQFWHYETNGGSNSMVHSSNALGRIMQQWKGDAFNTGTGWGDRRQLNSFLAFIVTTDDDGDDTTYLAGQGDDSAIDDCSSGDGPIVDGSTGNVCRWNDASQTPDFTSMADDLGSLKGFKTFMAEKYPSLNPGTDWSFYSIIGATGGTSGGGGPANGLPVNLQFTCAAMVETGQEFVKLSMFTGTEADMINICDVNWDLAGLADAIANSVPQNTYVLQGSPPGSCGNIDPATIVVYNNGIPMNPADWSYDAPTCTVTINNNIPQIGDNVLITYENF